VVEPDAGYLACGMTGPGRLAANEAIVTAVLHALGASQDLEGETVLITAGPTREKIDPVRYLTNRSSGRMGYALLKPPCAVEPRASGEGPTTVTPLGAAEVTKEIRRRYAGAVLELLPQPASSSKRLCIGLSPKGHGGRRSAQRSDDAGTEATTDILKELAQAKRIADRGGLAAEPKTSSKTAPEVMGKNLDAIVRE